MIEGLERCVGCMACRNICPHDAIEKRVDERGFIVPVVLKERCTNCGLCKSVCPILNIKEEAALPVKAYAMYHLQEDVVKKSSSGGAFYGLAKKTLEMDGIVFGCHYDIGNKRAYLADTDHLELDALLTSKYVESDIGLQYRQVKTELERGRKVLFCGTPCQAAGLRRYLNRSYDNLLVVDFTCGATTAQPYLKDYLEEKEKNYHSKLTRMSFRDKDYGWGQYCMKLEFENGKVYRKTAMSDPYFFCFLRSSMQRLGCHSCLFAHAHESDLVLADFWKCDHFEVDSNNRRGISLVLAMSDKGVEALEAIRKDMHMEDLDVEKASYNLRNRTCTQEQWNNKLDEILKDQECAYQEGVTVLRKRLLSPKQRLRFAFRQFVMDHEKLKKFFPTLVGTGQIM